MLEPAILYKEEIEREFQKRFYTVDMMYETGTICNWVPKIYECPDGNTFQYAILNKDKKVIGYLEYYIDWYVSKGYNFGLISFDKGNMIVVKDLFDKLEELVSTMHRVECRAVGTNPACRGYDNFIKKHNGNKHILKDAIRDKNGTYIDDIIYEIVK